MRTTIDGIAGRSALIGLAVLLGLVTPAPASTPAAAGSASASAAAAPLTLPRAEQLALEREPGARALQSRARAREHSATAAGALPDPTLTFGLTNVPTDRFDLGRDPMTQTRIGIRQPFPRAEKRRAERARFEALADADRARVELRRREVRREVRRLYLEAAHAEAVLDLLEAIRGEFDALVEITEREFAAGRSPRQDVIRAEVERERLADRIEREHARVEEARAELGRWVGPEVAARPLVPSSGSLAAPPDAGRAPEDHPALAAAAREVQAGREAVRGARADFGPDLGVEFAYGHRRATLPDGSAAPDLATVMFTLDLPLFSRDRQGARLAARRDELERAGHQRDDTRRDLQASYQAWWARHRRLEQRLMRYEQSLLPRSEEGVAAARRDYRATAIDFSALVRAHLAELDVRQEALRVRTDRDLARTEIRYLLGDGQ